MTTPVKWKDVVRDALEQLGGQGHLRQISEIINGNPKCRTNPTWRDTIRRVVRQYRIFQPVPPDKSGVYRLVRQQDTPLGPQSVKGTPSTKHGIVQGMLAGIGRTYGYETFVPRTDQTIRAFQGEPLSKHVTVNDCDSVFTSRNLAKIRQIDVIWFDEDDDGLFPTYAFEVEETTRVRSGLDRLLKIPRRLNTEYFVIGPTEEERALFERYCGQAPYREHRSRFRFRLYRDVEALYDAAAKHDSVRDEFGLMEKWRRGADRH